ncbi:hypothetical protein [Bradyrhizobium sp. SZCCHNRI1003]|uniref:hypothetical protein n=1 Tax=Bradyrhizobium sp. SZCCHNRI1003 TaxID=3057275 RepID=UPI002915D46A|nr:hypothetical protein [Bradyrhizobium sp. SZCCHNRI1003]
MSRKHPDHFELADRCLTELKILEKKTGDVLKPLRQIASELRPSTAQQFSSDQVINALRDQAFMSVSRLAEVIATEPASQEIASLWVRALDHLGKYRREAE